MTNEEADKLLDIHAAQRGSCQPFPTGGIVSSEAGESEYEHKIKFEIDREDEKLKRILADIDFSKIEHLKPNSFKGMFEIKLKPTRWERFIERLKSFWSLK